MAVVVGDFLQVDAEVLVVVAAEDEVGVIPVAVVVDGVVVLVVDEGEVVVASKREMKDHQQKLLKRGMWYMIVNRNLYVVGMFPIKCHISMPGYF